jgi:hypothetical protein
MTESEAQVALKNSERALAHSNLALARLEALRPVLIHLLAAAIPADVTEAINRAFAAAMDFSPIDDDPSQPAFDDMHERDLASAKRQHEEAVALFQSSSPEVREALRIRSRLAEQKLDDLRARPRTHREANAMNLKDALDKQTIP